MGTSCVVAGSYDPVTLGHLDIIERASHLFDKVHAAVLINSAKTYMFSIEEREAMLARSCRHLPNVETTTWSGLLVDALEHFGTSFVVRGVRCGTDFEYEQQIARANALLSPAAQTIWMSTAPEHDAISSTIVRELIRFGGDVSRFMPAGAIEVLHESHRTKCRKPGRA